jgi:ABC-type transport system involved in multi-copper enzyme maturation permease subunit
MNSVARALWNPIVAKEYRSRMRSWRSPLAMIVYIALLGGIGWAVFSSIAIAAGATGIGGNSYGQMGQTLFAFLVIFQVALLSFITPAVTAGAISGERERQTIDLLFVTPLPPFSIIWGKLLASISFAVLLLLLSVPIFSLVFLFGGIELDQMIEAYLVSAVTALMLGLVGIACSTFFKRTLTATVAAYGATFVLLVGTLVYGLLFPVDIDTSATTLPAPPAITFLGPVLPLVTIASNAPITTYGIRFGNGGGPFAIPAGGQSCTALPNGGMSCYSTSGGAKGGPSPTSFTPQPTTGAQITTGLFKGWQYWQASIAMQLVICIAALVFSALVLPPVRSSRWRLRRSPEPASL